MKKVLALLLIAFTCLSLAACGEEMAIIGTWSMDVTAVGEDVSEGEHYAYVCFDGEGNCTYAVFVGSEQVSKTVGRYTVEADQLTMIVNTREINCELEIDGDEMTITYGGNKQVFVRFTDDVIF